MSNSKKILKHFKILILLLAVCILNFSESLAQNSSAYNGIRNTTGANCDLEVEEELDINDKTIPVEPCYTSAYNDAEYKCVMDDFKFDVFTSKDLKWNLGNDSCIAYIVGTAIGLHVAFSACRLMCPLPPEDIADDKYKKLLDGIREAQRSTFRKTVDKTIQTAKTASAGNAGASSVTANATMIIDPFAIYELGIFTLRCANVLTVVDSSNCCAAALTCSAAYGGAVGALVGVYETAKNVFYNTKICGEGYKIFTKNPETKIYSKDSSPYAKFLKSCFSGDVTNNISDTLIDFNKCNFNKSYKKFCDSQNDLRTPTGSNANCKNVIDNGKDYKNQYFREYAYQGLEYEDNGSEACKNPNWSDSEEVLGYSSNGNQRYYLNGPGETPNYACSRYLAKGIDDDEGFKAYECCNKRSQETICLEKFDGNTDRYLFCKMNSKDCSVLFKPRTLGTALSVQDRPQIVPVKYKVFESTNAEGYLCASTYDVCPYDHNVMGGTDLADIYTNRQSIVTNFCQYMRHCIKKPPLFKYNAASEPGTYFSEACKNLIGDSQFINGVDTLNFIPIKSRNFSAPIVQCLKETLENNFMGKAGRTICKESDSYVDRNGKCISRLTGQNTEILYNKGQKINISIFQKIQNQLRNIIKFGMIFAVVFFGFRVLMAVPEMHINKKTISVFIIKISLVSFFALGEAWQGFFIDSIFNVSNDLSNITFQPSIIDDGCKFPKYNNEELMKRRSGLTVNEDDYKNKPISYAPGKDYLRIWDTLDCKLARALGYGPDVTSSNLAKMIFSGFLAGPTGITFFLASFAYGFLLISIILRAIHITIMSLVGIILLIYVSPITIMCSLFERTKGIFENWWKQLLGFILQPMILFAYLGLLMTIFDFIFIGDAKFVPSANKYSLPSLSCGDWNDSNNNNKLMEPNKTSIYCIFNFPKFKNYTGLELFDLAVPILMSSNKDKINTIFKAAILMFVFFNFLDKISLLAKKLVGGAELKSAQTPALANNIKKFAKGAQQRALNASLKYSGKIGGLAKSAIRSNSSKNENVKTDVDKNDSNNNSGSGFTSGE